MKKFIFILLAVCATCFCKYDFSKEAEETTIELKGEIQKLLEGL